MPINKNMRNGRRIMWQSIHKQKKRRGNYTSLLLMCPLHQTVRHGGEAHARHLAIDVEHVRVLVEVARQNGAQLPLVLVLAEHLRELGELGADLGRQFRPGTLQAAHTLSVEALDDGVQRREVVIGSTCDGHLDPLADGFGALGRRRRLESARKQISE